MPLYGYRGKTPQVARDAFIAPTAILIGDVTVRSGASVWFGTVLRGDMDRIDIGERSNVQDNSTVHTDEGEPTIVGTDVTIGHMALVHSSIVERNVLIGQAAVLVGRNKVGTGTIVGAGAVLPEGLGSSAPCRGAGARWSGRGGRRRTGCAAPARAWGSRSRPMSCGPSCCCVRTRSPLAGRACA